MNGWKRGILTNGWKRGILTNGEEGDPHELEMGICSSEMEMKSKISIIIKTGFRPLGHSNRIHCFPLQRRG